MMGRQTVDQSQLFYLFNLEEQIPADHLLRRLNPIVTRVLVDLREKLAPFYSDIGRPSIDPELMIRMLIVGYCYAIRQEPSMRGGQPNHSKKAPGEARASPGPILLLAGDGYSPPPPCCGVRAATGATIRSNSACGPGAPWIGTWVVTSSLSRLMLL